MKPEEIQLRTLYILEEILCTLKAMKQQEADYWETWKKAKQKENES